jgi:phosphoserine aminotransferase
MKLSHAIENSRGHQTYNTPALATLFLLNEQVKQLNQLGFKSVYAEAQRKAKMIYDWAEQKPYLSAFVQEAKYRSECVATIDIDSKYSADELSKRLRELGVAVDIEGYRKLGRNQLRIALFHNIKYDDLVKLTQAISFAVENTSV